MGPRKHSIQPASLMCPAPLIAPKVASMSKCMPAYWLSVAIVPRQSISADVHMRHARQRVRLQAVTAVLHSIAHHSVINR